MDGGIVSHARVALTGVGSNPYRAKAVEAALLGSDGSRGDGRGGRRARHGWPDRQRRHPCRQRVPVGHGRRLHPSRDRGRAGALARDERQPASRVQVLRVTPGRRAPARLAGAILARDVRIGAARWVKGRRLSADDLVALAGAEPGEPFSVIVIEPGELHEDDAALRLAAAVAGPNLIQRGPIAEPGRSPGRGRRRRSTSGSPTSSASTGSTRSRSSPPSTARSWRAATSSRASRSPRTSSTPPGSTRAREWRASAATRSYGSRRSSRPGSGSSSRSRSGRAHANGSRPACTPRSRASARRSSRSSTSTTTPRRSRRRWPASSAGRTRSSSS